MAIGVIGRKIGMTRVFNEEGASVPVTVIEVQPNRVVRRKDDSSDGYCAIQVTTGDKAAHRMNSPQKGEFAKAGVEAGRLLREFRVEDPAAFGDAVDVSIFEAGQYVDVSGVSIGKGFAGVIKRHNFHMQDATHGNSLSHRAPGSIGQNQTPGRVFKGKKMAGHMGARNTTVQNLQLFRIDAERNLLLVRGGVPGAKGSDVVVRHAVKK